MIGALKALFEAPARESDAARQHRLQLAAAALLVETARADFTEDGRPDFAVANHGSDDITILTALTE